MTVLTRHRIHHLEEVLHAQRQAALEEAEAELKLIHEQSVSEVAGEVSDTGDQSVAMLVTDMNNTMAQRHLDEVREIDRALTQIHGRDYGMCADCGDEIAYQRLEAFPTAVRCIGCQTRHERLFAYEGAPRL